jgi:hypothetical protein
MTLDVLRNETVETFLTQMLSRPAFSRRSKMKFSLQIVALSLGVAFFACGPSGGSMQSGSLALVVYADGGWCDPNDPSSNCFFDGGYPVCDPSNPYCFDGGYPVCDPSNPYCFDGGYPVCDPSYPGSYCSDGGVVPVCDPSNPYCFDGGYPMFDGGY